MFEPPLPLNVKSLASYHTHIKKPEFISSSYPNPNNCISALLSAKNHTKQKCGGE